MTTLPFKAWPLAAALVSIAAAGASAQQIYKSIGPDGRVTFSDKQPVEGTAVARRDASASAAGPALPFSLRQVVQRFPVTLYTGPNCGVCATARSSLNGRGIPFIERTVNTADDVEAMQRISGDSSLPMITIGSQVLRGYSDVEWRQYLDAAGYPATSQLPAGFRNPAPTPLVAKTEEAPVPETPRAAAPAPAVAPPVSTSPSNPAGIRF